MDRELWNYISTFLLMPTLSHLQRTRNLFGVVPSSTQWDTITMLEIAKAVEAAIPLLVITFVLL
jgi:hypothetical protein